jgi:hypothetical protein
MKLRSTIKKIITSSWFLATFPSILVFLLLPEIGSKYDLEVKPAKKFYTEYFYQDLNSDTISEIIAFGKSIPYFYINVYDNKFKIYDQWNLKDSMNKFLSDVFFGNIDKDPFTEVFIFTHKNDSLFLNAYEFLDPSGIKLERIYMTRIGFVKGEPTSMVRPAGFYDNNSDGFNELYFCITTAFDQPRKMYYYDFAKKTLKSSQYTSTLTTEPKIFDINGDMKPEIYGAIYASGNYSSKAIYTDSSAWLMVFNEQLEFEFEPVEFPGFGNSLYVMALEGKKKQGYTLVNSVGNAGNKSSESTISIYSTKGKLVSQKTLIEPGNKPLCFFLFL